MTIWVGITTVIAIGVLSELVPLAWRFHRIRVQEHRLDQIDEVLDQAIALHQPLSELPSQILDSIIETLFPELVGLSRQEQMRRLGDYGAR